MPKGVHPRTSKHRTKISMSGPKLLLTVDEAAGRLSISRAKLYTLVLSGEVESVKIGKSRRIPAAALEVFVDRLRSESAVPVRVPKSKTPTRQSWSCMITRCTNQNAANYRYYGGRGITVCERWRSFKNFLADMGERPEGSTLDRIDNDGNYEPGNCRWATPKEQAQNSRRGNKKA